MRKMGRTIIRGVVLLALIMLAATVPAFGQAEVQRLEVRVQIDGPAPHAVVLERLRSTVEAAAERLLVGRSVDQLRAIQPQLGATLAAVIDRVVPGYGVADVGLQLGAVTVVAVRFRPMGEVVGEIDMLPSAPTVHEGVLPLVLGPLRSRGATALRALYTGLPAAALPWADLLLEPRARAIVEDILPGFTATMRVRPGAPAQLAVIVAPRDSRVIRGLAVSFRSSSIPLLVLDDYEAQIAAMADPLRGLPVEFAEQRRTELAAIIDRALAVYPPALQYRIVATTMLEIGEATRVIVFADSVVYRARVEAQLNVGTSAPGPKISLHVGRMVAPGLEGFAELRIAPSSLALRGTVGAGYALSPTTTVGVSYALGSSAIIAWTTARLSSDISVRAAWDFRRRAAEGALIYRVNEFLSGEIIGTSRGYLWLRLVSNL